MKQSPLFSLNWNDAIKGAVMAILTPVVFLIQQTAHNGSLTFNWKSISMAAIAGFIAYLVKNFLSPGTPTEVTTTTADGTVTEKVISTDSLDVKVDAIK